MYNQIKKKSGRNYLISLMQGYHKNKDNMSKTEKHNLVMSIHHARISLQRMEVMLLTDSNKVKAIIKEHNEFNKDSLIFNPIDVHT